MAVTQWNPAHRAICKIRGIEPMVFASWYDLDQKFSLLRVFQKPHHYFSYGFQGGSFDLRTYTLDQFYQKHVLGWNTWSRSNEGFDLARYFGTKWTFYPHPHIAYIVFWERNWRTTEFEQLPLMHPFWLLVHKRNTFVVLPRTMRGRKKKLFIKPPSLQTSHWFYQSSWVTTALFRIGVTPVNLESPFVHKPSASAQPHYATWLGYGVPPTQNQKQPLPVKWSYSTWNTTAQQQWAKIMYRWWWDTGENNYILVNSDQHDAGTSNKMLTVLPIHYPYYVFFYGAMLPQGRETIKNQTDLPGKNPVYQGSQNPTPIAIWWYYDPGIYVDPDTQNLHIDTRYLRPEDIPQHYQGRTWVYLYNVSPFGGNAIPFDSDAHLQVGWTTWQIAPIIQALVQNSPFVVGKFDIPLGNRELNIQAKYTSVWQWGGTIPKPDTVVDPEQITENQPPTGAQVRNPATVGYANLHPWDLSQGGGINDNKLRAILTSILTPPGPAPPDASRPESPSPRQHQRRRRKRKRPTTPSESDESDGPAYSSRSSERRWQSRTPSSSEETETTETGTESESEEEPPTKQRLLQRKRLSLLKR